MKKSTYIITTIITFLVFAVVATGYVIKDHDTHSSTSDSHSAHENMEMDDMGAFSNDGRTVTVEPGEVLEVSSEGSDLSYDITEIRAQAGSELTIKYVNASTMPHNILFVYTEDDIRPVGVASLQAYQNEYVPEDKMDRIFAYTSLAVPGDTVEVTFTVPEEPGSYPYICTYPGHFTQMQGRLVVR